MSAISTYLQRILNAIWARDVRQAIHDAISQCYDDVNAPALQTEAMQAAVQAKIDAGEMAALTIADGSLTGAKLADGTIPTAKIADGAITAGKLASGAVSTDTTLTQSGIPADAKATGDAISAIKVAMQDAELSRHELVGVTAGRDISGIGLVLGKYRDMSSTSNALKTGSAYAISNGFMPFNTCSVTAITADYEFAILCYSDASNPSYSTRIGAYGWYDGGHIVVLPEGTEYVYYQVHKKDGTAITSDDTPTIISMFKTYKPLDLGTDTTLSVSGKPADSKETGDKFDNAEGRIANLEESDDEIGNKIDKILENKVLMDATFIRGSHTNGSGGEAVSDVAYRVTTQNKIHVDEKTTYTINPGFRVRRYRFINNSLAGFDSTWNTVSITLTPDYDYYINIARVDEDTEETADIEYFVSQVWRPLITVNLLPECNILAIGDSICDGGRNGNKGFVGDLGLPYVNAGIGGATISTVRDNTTHWIENQLTAQTDDFDVVIMEGGINDYIYNATLGTPSSKPIRKDIDTTEYDALDLDTVCGALEHLFSTCINKYPDAHRYFVITHKTRSYPWTAGGGGFTQDQLHDAIVTVCRLYNVFVIDVYAESPINTYFTEYYSPTPWAQDNSVGETEWVDNDKVHPLSYGYIHGYVPLIQKAMITCGYKWILS